MQPFHEARGEARIGHHHIGPGEGACHAAAAPAGLAQQREGRIRLLASTYPTAFRLLPGVPPVSSVLPGYGFVFWFGISVPAATP
jgi:hypothetical protein